MTTMHGTALHAVPRPARATMSDHPFYYSMVIDARPLHPYQAETLLFVPEKYARVPCDRIVLQCADRDSAQVRAEFAKNRYTAAVIQIDR